MRILALSFVLAALATNPAAAEQDLLLGADISSPAMTEAEMSRADLEAVIANADGKPIDLHDKALSGWPPMLIECREREQVTSAPKFGRSVGSFIPACP